MKCLLLGLSLCHLMSSAYMEMDVENFQVMYDKSFNLTCESKHYNMSALPEMDKPKYYYWILPNGAYLGTDGQEIIENKRVFISGMGKNYGKILTIRKADDDDYGIYHCLVKTYAQQYKLVARKSINVDGPYYGDLLDKYRTNIIIGVCAGGGLLVLCIIGCLVYHLRYRTDDDEEEDEEKLNGEITEIHAHDNRGLDKSDIPSSSSDNNYNDDISQEKKRPVSHEYNEIDTKL
ncbi:uncharacterized protein LOC135472945 [Liolophura sinensis]|uniref:uncharacterized protein LOC135472945 n=1 Tax=Liolophura sinensis TaxID=3198878 RepID=UPI0031595843